MARQARFHRNGDAFAPGKRVVVSSRRYNSLDKLLDFLSRRLLTGVTRLVDARSGREVRSLEEVVQGGVYVAAAKGERFKPLDYCALSEPQETRQQQHQQQEGEGEEGQLPYAAHHGKLGPSRGAGLKSRRHHGRRRTRPALPPLTAAPAGNVVDIYVQTKGGMERIRHRLLVNARTARSLEQVLDSLSSAVHVNGGVRRLYTLQGARVDAVETLYDVGAIAALGLDRLDREALSSLQLSLANKPPQTAASLTSAVSKVR
jgi:hypothetical protein